MLLDQVVPWGRSLHEYQLMFDLAESDLDRRILGCGDGPASFNSEMAARGRRVISADPIYAFTRQQIQQRVEETYDTIISQVKLHPERYVWHYFSDADALGYARMEAMRTFLNDFEAGKSQGRYLPEALPTFSFGDGAFEMALCSHLLFLYSQQLSLDFHVAAIEELLRVAGEVRIFPLLGLDCRLSPHLRPIQKHFQSAGYVVETAAVAYEFQRMGNQMLRLSRQVQDGPEYSGLYTTGLI